MCVPYPPSGPCKVVRLGQLTNYKCADARKVLAETFQLSPNLAVLMQVVFFFNGAHCQVYAPTPLHEGVKTWQILIKHKLHEALCSGQ